MIKFIESSTELEKHIKEEYFMSYQDFCEVKLLLSPDEDGYCYRCNKPLEPLTYYEPEFCYQPCLDCLKKTRRKIDKAVTAEGVLRNIRDYYAKVTGDRYFQLFIVDEIYFSATFPHNYSVFKKVVNSLDPPNRNDIWFLDWIPGYPKIISMENLPGIKIVNLTKQYGEIDLGKDTIKVGEYEIHMPESSPYDPRHHSRYSILNKSGDRKTKRLRLGDNCFKFYNTPDENVKSLFKITKNGEDVSIRNLTYQDFVIIKLAIMRDKTFLKFIFDVVVEIAKSAESLKDSIFLKNTVHIDPKKSGCLNLIWTSLSDYKNDNYLNISII